ncbi:Plug domain-containing protein [Nibrella saemangeumensis]|uniref:Plug domain-containing protein n=1 Tax=Nibrella saemangeumensis TaxID=1084526 RepID=A0ABP8NK76_9BACT
MRQAENYQTLLCGLTVAVLVLLSVTAGYAQPADALREVVQRFDQHRRQALQEKVFVHTDQSVYLTGETMWFKVYCVEGATHQPLDMSKVSYLEVLDMDRKPVLQTKLQMTAGSGNGALPLPTSLNSGNYLLRAYTNWMKNYSADFFFEKAITIINPFKRLGLPYLPAQPEYDAQFFPEGGNLVSGLPGKVAFRVTNAAGQGIDFQGWLLTAQNDTVARFRPHKFGMGYFQFTPAGGTTYRAVIRDADNRTLTRPLPAVSEQGYTMRVEEGTGNQLTVMVNTNLADAGAVHLLAHTRQVIKLAETRTLGRETSFLLDKKALGEGITHLTLFDRNRRPVGERLYFKRPEQPLTIQLNTDQAQYAARTKVNLSVDVPASAARSADLSVAVYRIDSLPSQASANVLSYLWLTSDLRGTIESPDYYLQPESAEVREATDNLMLTHGWRRFKWDEVLAQPRLAFPFVPEYNGHLVRGRLVNPVTQAPVARKVVYLSVPGKLLRLYTARSDSAGQVLFEMKDFYESQRVLAQPNPADSSLRLTIDSPFAESLSGKRLPAFDLNAQATQTLLDRSVVMQVQNRYWAERMMGYRYPTIDSTAFYGTPTERYRLDDYTRFPAMEEVLREYVRGVMPRKRQGSFRLVIPNSPYRDFFEDQGLVMIDGVPVFDIDKLMAFSPLKIRQMDVITNRYFVNSNFFNGVFSLMTYKGDLAGYPLPSYVVQLPYDGLQVPREYYTPRYETQSQLASRIPDGRTLLYWNPSVKPNAQGKAALQFYTSDQEGTYRVEVNGLTRDGQAGSQGTQFLVKSMIK